MITIENILTFTTGGVLGYLLRIFIEHRLSRSRSLEILHITEFNKAAREFRAKVNESLALFQRREENWNGNNRNFRAASNFVHIIDLAVKDFAQFLTEESKTGFINKWQETKDYCSTTLPKSWTRDVSDAANESKITFFQHVEDLLKFADKK